MHLHKWHNEQNSECVQVVRNFVDCRMWQTLCPRQSSTDNTKTIHFPSFPPTLVKLTFIASFSFPLQTHFWPSKPWYFYRRLGAVFLLYGIKLLWWVVLKESLSFLTGETTKYNLLSLVHAVTNGCSIYLSLDIINRYCFY